MPIRKKKYKRPRDTIMSLTPGGYKLYLRWLEKQKNHLKITSLSSDDEEEEKEAETHPRDEELVEIHDLSHIGHVIDDVVAMEDEDEGIYDQTTVLLESLGESPPITPQHNKHQLYRTFQI